MFVGQHYYRQKQRLFDDTKQRNILLLLFIPQYCVPARAELTNG